MSGVHSEHNLRENANADPTSINNEEDNAHFVLPVLPAAKKLIWNETGEWRRTISLYPILNRSYIKAGDERNDEANGLDAPHPTSTGESQSQRRKRGIFDLLPSVDEKTASTMEHRIISEQVREYEYSNRPFEGCFYLICVEYSHITSTY